MKQGALLTELLEWADKQAAQHDNLALHYLRAHEGETALLNAGRAEAYRGCAEKIRALQVRP